MYLGWSSCIYPLSADDFAGVPDYAGEPIPGEDLPDDRVVLYLRNGGRDSLLRGRDAFGRGADGTPYLPNGLRPGSHVRAGELLWCGTVKSGDFLFVNRWIWNFRHPRRGEVMIFATTGLDGVQQGTHYIKRMAGLPGETLTMDPPRLVVNGEPVPEEGRLGQIMRREKFSPDAFPYPGFNFSGTDDPRFDVPGRTLAKAGDEVMLGPDEYYACGDNSPASYDSRWWGPVPGKLLRGRAGGVFWPFGSPRWGIIR